MYEHNSLRIFPLLIPSLFAVFNNFNGAKGTLYSVPFAFPDIFALKAKLQKSDDNPSNSCFLHMPEEEHTHAPDADMHAEHRTDLLD